MRVRMSTMGDEKPRLQENGWLAYLCTIAHLRGKTAVHESNSDGGEAATDGGEAASESDEGADATDGGVESGTDDESVMAY